MGWNYRIVLHDLDPDPNKHWFGLHEVYYGTPEAPRDETKVSPTVNPITFCCGLDEGPEGIIGSLEMALKTLKDPKWATIIKESDE